MNNTLTQPAVSPDPNDLIVLQERIINKRVSAYWVSEEFLLRCCQLPSNYLWKRARPMYLATVSSAKKSKDVLPDTGAAWRFARIKGKFYYCYNNIPDVAPTFYKSRLPRPEHLEQLVKMAGKSDRLEQLERLVRERLEGVAVGYLPHYYGYKLDQTQRLAKAAAAVQLCIEMGEAEGLLSNRSEAWFRDFAEVVKRLDLDYLPTHWRRLRDKVRAAMESSVPDAVTLPREGNQHARKFDDLEIESWVIQMRGMGQNFTSAFILRKVQQMCLLTGKPVPSDSWLAQALAAPETKFLTSAGRYGERGRQGQIYKLYTPVANALFANDAWQVDATRVNFLPWKGEDGREVYLYMTVVRDVHSGAVLGWHFDVSESRYTYISALRMACQVAGALPYELVVDRFPGHNTEEWQLIQRRMELVAGVKVSYKHTATGKAQLERWFETLQSVFFNESEWYYGEGIQSRRQAAHRSAEYLKLARRTAVQTGWNQDAATAEAQRCIMAYNDTALNTYSRKHRDLPESPRQLYETSRKPHSRTVDAAQRALLFGLMKRVTIRNGLIRTEIARAEYLYEVNDYATLKAHRTVLLAYELENLETAWLYEDNPERALNPALLAPVQSLERVQVYGPQADYKALGRQQGRQNRLNEQRQNDLAQVRAAGSEVTLLLQGMSTKDEAERAESAWLSEATARAPLPPPAPESEGGDLDIAAFVYAQM